MSGTVLWCMKRGLGRFVGDKSQFCCCRNQRARCQPGKRDCRHNSLAEYRSPNSPLLVPPLLRLGFVGVLTSVPVALVIKRAGYTHTRHKERGGCLINPASTLVYTYVCPPSVGPFPLVVFQVPVSTYGVRLAGAHPKQWQSVADLSETRMSPWKRGRPMARADRARRNSRAPALPPRAWQLAAGGREVAETTGGSTRAASSRPQLSNRRTEWPPCCAQVSCTPCPCMCLALCRIPSGRRLSCLRSPSCAGHGRRGLVGPFLQRACLDALKLLREQGLTDERHSFERGESSACMSGRDGRLQARSVRGRAALCMPCACLRAVALANVTEGFPSVCVLL